MLDASVVRKAAQQMRGHATMATPSADPRPGGWSGYVMDDGRCEMYAGPAEVGYRAGLVFSFSVDCDECARPSQADVDHMAGWHPSVALAVADWLDYCADRADRTSAARLEYDDEERAWFLPALAIAQAYLGELPLPLAEPAP